MVASVGNVGDQYRDAAQHAEDTEQDRVKIVVAGDDDRAERERRESGTHQDQQSSDSPRHQNGAPVPQSSTDTRALFTAKRSAPALVTPDSVNVSVPVVVAWTTYVPDWRTAFPTFAL